MKKIKLKETSKKVITKITTTFLGLMFLAKSCFADVSIDSNGGAIKDSAIGQGVYKMAQDVAGTLRWLIPVISIPFILFFLVKMLTGEEQEQPRYKKKLISTLIIVIASTLVTVLINLVMGYFG